MKPHPTVAETFAALEALQADVDKSSHDIGNWCVNLKRSKANQQTAMLMLMSRHINEKLMKRLWTAEREAIDARREVRIAQHEIQEWQFTALVSADPVSDSLH
jgi:hypothetical protein